MKTFVTFAAVAALAVMPLSGAWAVDVVNQDADGYTLLVGSGDDVKDVEIGGNQTIENICDACEVTLDDGDPVKAEGNQVVTIKGGKATIGG